MNENVLQPTTTHVSLLSLPGELRSWIEGNFASGFRSTARSPSRDWLATECPITHMPGNCTEFLQINGRDTLQRVFTSAKLCVFRKVIVQKITQLSFSLTRKPGMRVYDSLVVVGSQLGAPATKCGCASFRATGALFSALYTRSGVHSHHFVCCDEGPTKKYFYATLMVA